MKGHKSTRKHRASGGVNDMAEDAAKKNQSYTFESHVNDEAEERKRGGKAVGKVKGHKGKAHMGRAPRKSGGRTGSNARPLSSASKGTPAPGRNVSGSLD